MLGRISPSKQNYKNSQCRQLVPKSSPRQLMPFSIKLFRDKVVQRAMIKFGLGVDRPEHKMLESFGEKCGSANMMEHADLAERNRPILKQFDNYGRRIDCAEFHPSYHVLMNHSLSSGVASYGFNNGDTPNSHLVRGSLAFMENQLESGHCCPTTMTFASIPVIRKSTGHEDWAKLVQVQGYDPRNVPISEKSAVTIGMSMTEKQGGSDVRANTTLAVPVDDSKRGQEGSGYLLTGHKWFTSAPMCDGFLTLAKCSPNDPPSCFLVPRWLPDGSRNLGFKVMRLKDKLADRANASSEVEYDNAWGTLVGEEKKGVKTIIEMVQGTRWDCCLGSAGTGRRSLHVALNHASGRFAFGAPLTAQPLMQNLLTDLCVESEAHTLTALWLGMLYDNYERTKDDSEKELFRVAVSVAKYYITKRQPNFAYECMEVMGGIGFVEDFPMAKLYRHAPLNSIWEGSGNVIALDLLRAHKQIPVLMAEINKCRGMCSHMDLYLNSLATSVRSVCADPMSSESQRAARNLADRLAVALQGSLMLRFGNPVAAEGFMQSRIGGTHGGANYGSTVFSSSMAQDLIQDNMPVFV